MYDPYRQGMHDDKLEETTERLSRWVSEATRNKVKAYAEAAFIFTADYFEGKIGFEIPDGQGVRQYEFQERGPHTWLFWGDRNPGEPYPSVTNEQLEARMLELWDRYNKPESE